MGIRIEDRSVVWWETAAAMVVISALGYIAFRSAGQPGTALGSTEAFTRVVRLTAVVIAGGAVLLPRRVAWLREWLGLAAACSAIAALISYVFRDTFFSLGGDSQDAGFIIQQLTAAKYYGFPVDGTYAGLSAFYPPLYTQVLGKVAAAFDMEAAATWKLGALAMTCVAPVIAFTMWVPLVGRRSAALVVVFYLLANPVQHLHKTHEWLSLFIFVPWWLRYVALDGGSAAGPKRDVLVGGLWGAAIFCTFYYWFFVAGVALLLTAGWRMSRGRPALGRAPALTLLLSAALASPYWLPLLADMIGIDNQPLQQRWYRAYMNRFPVTLSRHWRNLVLLGGALALLLGSWASYRQTHVRPKTGQPAVDAGPAVFAALGALTVGYVAWYLLGRWAVEVEHPILHVKAVPMVRYLLQAGFLLGIATLAGRAGPRVGRVFAAAAIAGTLAVQVPVYANVGKHKLFEKAKQKGLRKYAERLSKKTRVLGDLRGVTVLAADARQLQYSPAFQFLGLSAHYAHPSARFESRHAFLSELVKLDDSTGVCLLMRHNRFAAIDLMWWPVGATKSVYLDNFPHGVRTGHIRWSGAGRDGACLQRVRTRATLGDFYRVKDPGLDSATGLGPSARRLAQRYGSARLRALTR